MSQMNMQEEYIVIVLKGKGKDTSPDFIELKRFDNHKKATEFINGVNDLESKYWTYADFVNFDTKYEPFYGSL